MTSDTRCEVLEQNCEGLAAFIGLGKEVAWATVEQVHGIEVKEVKGLQPGEVRSMGEGDGLWTEQPGVALAVRTADCVPILLMDGRLKRVGVLHAGRRGILGGIVGAHLQLWLERGSSPEDIWVALGPSIGPCCYRVEEALAEPFAQKWSNSVLSFGAADTNPSLYLARAIEADVLRWEIPSRQLQSPPICTSCDLRFHSYRRNQKNAGRQLSWVVCP
jgi:YfiH family protein